MPDVMQSLWVGNELSRLERLSIASFLAAGHDYHLYTYEDVKGVPTGVTLRDAGEILDSGKIYRHRSGSLALFADEFRWELLRTRGGWWVDTDMLCLRTFDFDDELVFGKETDVLLNTAVLKVPAGHAICSIMLERCRHPNRLQACDNARSRRRKWLRKALFQGLNAAKWGELGGPIGFTLGMKHLGLFDRAQPFTTFYPVGPHNWQSLIDGTFTDRDEFPSATAGIHLWTEMMRRDDFSKDGPYPEASLLHSFEQKLTTTAALPADTV